MLYVALISISGLVMYSLRAKTKLRLFQSDMSLWHSRKKGFVWAIAVGHAGKNKGDERDFTWYLGDER